MQRKPTHINFVIRDRHHVLLNVFSPTAVKFIHGHTIQKTKPNNPKKKI